MSRPFHGEFAPEFRGQIPGADTDPRFWASGISLIAHLWNPHVPAVHMNTRFGRHHQGVVRRRRRPDAGARHARTQHDPDTVAFHAAMKAACDGQRGGRALRKIQEVVRRVLSSSSTATRCAASAASSTTISTATRDADFAFTQDVGRAFVKIYPELVRRNFATPWTEAEREEQLIRRGRYVEFNLLYDRGTVFGLKTGGNVESILSSMPPVVKWP